jgi:hypothetical protein
MSTSTIAVDMEQAGPVLAFAKNRYVQIGGMAIAALVLVALTVYALLRVPRVRDALRDVWPFKLMLQTARKKTGRTVPARPFYDDESSCDEHAEVHHEPFSALSRIVLLNEQACGATQTEAKDRAECESPQRAEPAIEVLDDEAPVEQRRATFSRRKRAA